MHDSENITKQVEAKYAEIYNHEGILYYIYKPLDLLDLDRAKVCVEDRINFSEGVSYPCLFDIRSIKEVTKEARDYLANEGNDLVIASSIIVASPRVKMIANFFIFVNKPKRPTRMFTSKADAVEWLQQFI